MKNLEIFVPLPVKSSVSVEELTKKISVFAGIDIDEAQVSSIKAWNSQKDYNGFTVNPKAEKSSMLFPTVKTAQEFKEESHCGVVWS